MQARVQLWPSQTPALSAARCVLPRLVLALGWKKRQQIRCFHLGALMRLLGRAAVTVLAVCCLAADGVVVTERRDLEACLDWFGKSRCSMWSSGCADNAMIRRQCRSTCGLCGKSTDVRPEWPSYDTDGDGLCSRDEVKSALKNLILHRYGMAEQTRMDELIKLNDSKTDGPFPCDASLAVRFQAEGVPLGFWEDLLCKSCPRHVETRAKVADIAQTPFLPLDSDSLSLLVAIPAAKRSKQRDAMVQHTLHELSVLSRQGVRVEVRVYSFDAWDDVLNAVDGLRFYPLRGTGSVRSSQLRIVAVQLDPRQTTGCRDAHIGDFVRLVDDFTYFM